jgi:hypothetical protein
MSKEECVVITLISFVQNTRLKEYGKKVIYEDLLLLLCTSHGFRNILTKNSVQFTILVL